MKIFDINKDHPVVERIRQEISKQYKSPIGLGGVRIDNSAVCNTDIYGFRFNTNNNKTNCINLTIYSSPLIPSVEVPKYVESMSEGDEIKGYDCYQYSSSATIKLSNFLDKNPDFKNIEDWTEPIIYKKKKFKYDGHNSQMKTVGLKMGNIRRSVKWPEGIEDDKDILTWAKELGEAETKKYYRNKALDKVFNIKRGLTVYVEGLWFTYDYKDGVIEVKGVRYNQADHFGGLHKAINSVFDITNNPKIIEAIEKSLTERWDKEIKIKELRCK